jgi:hypothetical protein
VATTNNQASAIGVGPTGRRVLRLAAIVIAGLGLALGLQGLAHHAATDPFVDLRTYYDAGTRLNAGQPLYDPSAVGSTGLYLYPPLLAILFRPIALLPFDVVSGLWLAASIGAVAVTIRRAGLREPVFLAAGCLALPILWSVSIGQVEPLVTLALAFASPVGIGIASSIKIFPALVAVYWIARQEWRSLVTFGVTVALLGVFQILVEPSATRTWLEFTWLRPAFAVRNISPYAVHPLLWVALVIVLGVAAWRLGPTRRGWGAAVTLAVLVHPRLLAYQLMSLLAAFAGPTTNAPSDATAAARAGT